MANIWTWIVAHWSQISTALVLALWAFKSWKDGVLKEQLLHALALIIDVAKDYAGEIPKVDVLKVAYAIYDAEELFNIPSWLNWAIDSIKLIALGSKEEFGEKVWQLWQEYLASQDALVAAGLI
jgi:hypothetical protein